MPHAAKQGKVCQLLRNLRPLVIRFSGQLGLVVPSSRQAPPRPKEGQIWREPAAEGISIVWSMVIVCHSHGHFTTRRSLGKFESSILLMLRLKCPVRKFKLLVLKDGQTRR